jgi:hypothetical protein
MESKGMPFDGVIGFRCVAGLRGQRLLHREGPQTK